MTLSALSALSPLDGRYAGRVAALRPLMSAFIAGARETNPKAEFSIRFIHRGFAPPAANPRPNRPPAR